MVCTRIFESDIRAVPIVDCRLLIDVADTSLAKDHAKAAIYAEAGVTEYWIVNLPNRQLERFRHPGPNSIYVESIALDAEQSLEFDVHDRRLCFDLRDLF